jgi:hypothetical protein
MEYILTSLDMFASIAENLINFTFNVSHFAVLTVSIVTYGHDFLLTIDDFERYE